LAEDKQGAGSAAIAGAPVQAPAGGRGAPTKIKDVKPIYPLAAQIRGIQGIVIVEASIGADGTVTSVRVMRSVPGLDEAAADAVRQWVFAPHVVNGVPSPLVSTMTITFSMPRGLPDLPASRNDPAGPLEQSAARSGPVRQAPARTSGVLPPYPSNAKKGERGLVGLYAIVDAKGAVREVRAVWDAREPIVTSSRNTQVLGKAFVDAALKAVKQWRYEPPGQSPVIYTLQMQFTPGEETRLLEPLGPRSGSAAPTR
jgi:TonB family protein